MKLEQLRTGFVGAQGRVMMLLSVVERVAVVGFPIQRQSPRARLFADWCYKAVAGPTAVRGAGALMPCRNDNIIVGKRRNNYEKEKGRVKFDG